MGTVPLIGVLDVLLGTGAVCQLRTSHPCGGCWLQLGEVLAEMDPLERLLRCGSEAAHAEIAAMLWDSASDAEAAAGLRRLAGESVEAWEADERAQGRDEDGQDQG
jgi:hypothetical protein